MARIKQDYTPGKLLTGGLKAICISHLQEYVKAFQERRTHVTDEVVEDFFARKELIFKGNSNAKVVPKESGAAEIGLEKQMGETKVEEKSKNQEKRKAHHREESCEGCGSSCCIDVNKQNTRRS